MLQEKGLFSCMISSFDEYNVEKLFQDTNALLLREKMQFKEGRISIYNNQIVYKFYFSSFAIFSLLVDENGKFLGFAEPTNYQFLTEEDTESYIEIIDREVVKRSKVEFLNSLSAPINRKTIYELLKNIYMIESVGEIIYRQGEIVAFKDQVAYQFDYEVQIIFSILIDQKGNVINTDKKGNKVVTF